MEKERVVENNVCIYCLAHCTELTTDHVIPRSWYPDSSPKGIWKFQVPSCKKCNNYYSKIEQNLLLKLGMCLNRSDIKCAGVPQKVMRSLSPGAGKNYRDSKARLRKREEIKRAIKEIPRRLPYGILPNFGSSLVSTETAAAIKVEEHNLMEFAKKLVRGVTYILSSSLIYNDDQIEVLVCEQGKANEFEAIIRKFGKKHSLAPGLNVSYVAAADCPEALMIRIEIWSRLIFYCFVHPPPRDRAGTN